MASVRRGSVSIDLVFGAYQSNTLICACLAAESPGAVALVFASGAVRNSPEYAATVSLLRAVQDAAWHRDIALLEALAPPEADVLGDALNEAGFRYLTCLRYLRRHGPPTGPRARGATDLEWVTYSPDREPLFESALERTYVQSQDCPELTGLRGTAQVLAGHRATGLFDPGMWWVACREGEPAGILLLNRVPRNHVLEVVYMGVAHAARGTGVADALMWRAVLAGADSRDSRLALAVDERNAPARRLYERWGFVEAAMRNAWIASPPKT
jgi:GNAT superfamily N-acetyltransferase